MGALALAKRFIEAVEAGDIKTAQRCFTKDAGIWHNYDGKVQTVEENMTTLQWMMDKAKSREYHIKRLEQIKGGYVQQHILRITDNKDEKIELFACALVSVRDNKISYIEEYIDPSPLASWLQE